MHSLADDPYLGRTCDRVRSGLRRFEVQKHVIFYVVEEGGIFVIRVLHAAMLPQRYH